LLVHGLVAAFLFINIIAYHGLLNQTMIGLGIWDEPRRLQNDRNAIGVIILQTWKNMPFALLLLTGAVQSISDDVLNAGRDLGAGAFDRSLLR
jgi:putative spermidine/putrescine transport system permease protein